VSAAALKWIAITTLTLLAAAAGYWLASRHAPAMTETDPTQTKPEPMPTNRLALETSPYLRLHQHNPVDWYPWGAEAQKKARAEDKPIFLSVGYSSCYWCHVMERLVFSDPEIARLMNLFFVNIKVDREERPDIDALYMTATQLIDGHGGWPNSVFLTPDLKPFFAGTYFPPDDSHGRPGFPRVLNALHLAWQKKRNDILSQSEEIVRSIRGVHESRKPDTTWSQSEFTTKLQAHFESRFDWQEGGFGNAPKFPPDQALALLVGFPDLCPDAPEMVSLTLGKMALGGIQDHLGGGFHRYSTDRQWRVPHFEKMLYNQAMFAQTYLLAYDKTHDPLYRETVVDIFRFVSAQLTNSEGGFYSALDAETDGEEGAHYVWTEGEIREILGRGADLFLEAYALAPVPGSQAGALYRTRSNTDLARTENESAPAIEAKLSLAKKALLDERNQRTFPLKDDKIIAGWNGLMIAAYARSARVLERPQDAETAGRASEFVLEHLIDETGELYRVYHSGVRKIPAYQEDYAYVIHGLIELYRTTRAPALLEKPNN
jgi:uncharacterized protein